MKLSLETTETLLMLVAIIAYSFLGYVAYLLFVPSAAPQWMQAGFQSIDSTFRPYESQIREIGVAALVGLFLYEFWTLQQNVATIRRELAELNEKLRNHFSN